MLKVYLSDIKDDLIHKQSSNLKFKAEALPSKKKKTKVAHAVNSILLLF